MTPTMQQSAITRTIVVPFRLAPAEYQRLKALAAQDQRPVSNWVRLHVLEAMEEDDHDEGR